MSTFYEQHYGKFCFQPRVEAVTRLLASYLHRFSKQSLRILDIGCGNGESVSRGAALVDQRGILYRDRLRHGIRQSWRLAFEDDFPAMGRRLRQYCPPGYATESTAGLKRQRMQASRT